MIVAALFALAHVAAGPADFFPLTEGTRWKYQDAATRSVMEDLAMPPIKLNQEDAFPVDRLVEGKHLLTYYRIIGDTIFCVAYDSGKPLPKPVPVFKYEDGKRVTWEFKGDAEFLYGPAPLELKGWSKPAGEKTYLGKQVETLEVHVSAKIQVGAKSSVTSETTQIYGRGIGLLEETVKGKITDREVEQRTTLLEFTAPGGGAG